MHLALFSYHDHKTKDIKEAWYHLTTAHRFKMATLPTYDIDLEQRKVDTLIQVFNEGFWPLGVGSPSKQPIFIIGFPRSGSTLLERVLDSHSQIAGTGEDSIFNGMLDEIRNAIIKASMQQSATAIQDVVQKYTIAIDSLTLERWQSLQTITDSNVDFDGNASNIDNIDRQPKRFVDKMLTNYANVGFIHLLYPNALILHVMRDPMDTIFSAYKHDFPPGKLDYTSDFTSLTHMYKSYRVLMDHWEKVLPGRVIHVKYEDMVNNMPRVAQSIIAATDLSWEPDVLEFHKKKQAVNTLSTTQVRKAVYKDSIKSWKRYEDYLVPLVKSMGSLVRINFSTSLKGYTKV